MTDENVKKLTALGFSEESARVVNDFLGERVVSDETEPTLKKEKPTPTTWTNSPN